MKNLVLTLAAVALGFSQPASAAFVVDTGTPTPNASRYVLDPIQSLAAFFTLSSATTIKSVEGYVRSSGGNTATITIYSNGTVPVSANSLFSASFTTLPGSTDAWQGVFNQNWALAAGSYWVGFGSTGDDAMLGTAPSPLSAYAFTTRAGDWANFPLNVGVRLGDSPTAAVPEPATWLMMIFGFGLVGGAMRYRQRQPAKVSFG
jgi:hypothetical protein